MTINPVIIFRIVVTAALVLFSLQVSFAEPSNVRIHPAPYFERNVGQVANDSDFIVRQNDLAAYYIDNTSTTLAGPAPSALTHEPSVASGSRRTGLTMQFARSNSDAEELSEQPLESFSRYVGARYDGTKTAAHFERIGYRNVYENIDVAYYFDEDRLQYDLIAHPGSDPKDIVIAFEGSDSIEVDADGNLIIRSADWVVSQSKPVIYQLVEETRELVDGQFVVNSDRTVSIHVGEYDEDLPLIIDPVWEYQSYLSIPNPPASFAEYGELLEQDSAGNYYVAGSFGPIGWLNAGQLDIFVFKISADGSTLLNALYIQGNSEDDAGGMEFDGNGSLFMVGRTLSDDLPMPGAGYDSSCAAGDCLNDNSERTYDAFVYKIDTASLSIVAGTYFGGKENDRGYGIALDSASSVLISGSTNSSVSDGFPVTIDALDPTCGQTQCDNTDAFVAIFDNSLSSLTYSTYFGGDERESAVDIELDANSNIYIAGDAGSNFVATTGAARTSYGGGLEDAFVAKFSPDGTILEYATLLGGNQSDGANALAVDRGGRAVVVGVTQSTDFPVSGRYINQRERGCSGAGVSIPECDPLVDPTTDGFVAQIAPNGSHFIYSTYLGGDAQDILFDVAIDHLEDQVLVVGRTRSTGLGYSPFGQSRGNVLATPDDGLLAVIDKYGRRAHIVYIGGNASDEALSVKLDAFQSVIVSGATKSSDFVTGTALFPAYQSSVMGDWDAFVEKYKTDAIKLLYIDDFVTTSLGNKVVHTDPSRLWKGGQQVAGIAADGSTNVLIRLLGFIEPGTVRLSLFDETGLGTLGVGSLSLVDRSVSDVQVLDVPTSGPLHPEVGHGAFATLTAPDDFVRSGSASDELAEERTIRLRAEFIPNSTGEVESTIWREISLRRPVTMFMPDGYALHPDSWRWDLREDNRFYACATPPNWPDVFNRPSPALIGEEIHECLTNYRLDRGIASSKVDLFAHGVSGLLSREYMASSYYPSDTNLNDGLDSGAIHKLITVDTPHLGSEYSQFVIDRGYGPTDIYDTFDGFYERLGFFSTNWAIEDTGTQSEYIATLPGVARPGTRVHAFAGGGGNDDNLDDGPSISVYDFTKRNRGPGPLFWLEISIKVLTTAFRETINFGGADHDYVTSAINQIGGLPASNYTIFQGDAAGWTSGVPFYKAFYWTIPEENLPAGTSPNDVAIDLINASTSDAAFATSLPAGNAAWQAPPNPQSTGNPNIGLAIVSPIGGAIVQGGDSVEITVEPINGFIPDSVSIISELGVVIDRESPFTVTLPVSADANGAIRIMALGYDVSDVPAISEPVDLQVNVPATLTGLAFKEEPVRISGVESAVKLYVKGTYDDGIERDLSGSSYGTTYLTHDPEIATVDAEGVVRPGLKDGRVVIVASNSGRSTFTNITVSNVNAPPEFLGLYDPVVGPGETLNFDVFTKDPDESVASLVADILPAGAIFTDNGDGSGRLTWSPTATDLGFHELRIIATDGTDPSISGEGWAVIEVAVPVNQPPIARAGSDQRVFSGDTVTLSGSTSIDPDGAISSYSWEVVPFITYLTGTTGPTLQFIAPDVAFPTDLTYTLTVTDNNGAESSDVVVVTVEPPPMPIANAGPDQVVDEGTLVSLDGSGSSHENGVIADFLWQQISPATPVANLTGAASATATFTAPDINVDTNFTFRLTVTDTNSVTDTDDVDILVRFVNQPPIANAGLSRTVIEGDTVVLDGSASADVDGTISSYTWTQLAGPTAALAGSNTVSPTFVAPTVNVDTSLEFELTVSDNNGASGTATVTINVLDRFEDSDMDGLADGWEIANFGDLTSQDGNGDPDGDGVSNLQEYQEGTSPTIPEPVPARVDEISAIAGDSENVVVWKKSTGAAAHNLYWSASPGVTIATGNLIPNVSSPFVHAGLSNGSHYYYVVTAENNAGESPVSPEVSAAPGPRVWGAPVAIAAAVDSATGYPTKDYDSAIDGQSNTVIVWSENDGSRENIWARRLPLVGNPELPELLETDDSGDTGSPKIAMNSDGRAIAVWIQSDGTRDSLWASELSPDSQDWSVPQLLENHDGSNFDYGNVRGPQIAMNSSGFAAVVWGQEKQLDPEATQFDFSLHAFANLFSPRTGWSTPTLIDTPELGDSESTVGSYYPISVAVNEVNDVLATWKGRVFSSAKAFSNRYTTDSGWQGAQTLYTASSSGGATSISNIEVQIDAIGRGVAVFSDGSAPTKLLSLTFDPQSGWQATADKVSKRNVPGRWPVLAMNEAGSAIAVWSGTDVFANSYAPGTNWDRAGVIGVDGQFFVDVAMASTGNGIAIWRKYNSGVSVGPYVSHYDAGSGWGSEVLIGNSSDAVSALKVIADDYGNAVATWNQNGQLWASRFAVVATAPPNSAPVANAGADQTAVEGALVVLDGSGSSDSDGSIASYQWSQTAGPTVFLSDPTSASPTFTAPNVGIDTTLTFSLTVTDDDGATGQDTVDIFIDAPNVPPSSNAGIDQTVVEGSIVTLDGSGSSDSDGSISLYNWLQTLGPAVTLSASDSISPTFSAPAVSSETTLTFDLTVTDNEGATSTDSVNIVVQPAPPNIPPTANAGTDQIVSEGAIATLDGSGSSDSDGIITGYSWVQTAGPAVALSDPTVVSPTFTAPSVTADTTLSFVLTVTDDASATAQDTTNVLVQDGGADVTPPVTTIVATKLKIKGKTFYDVELTADEPATTSFSVTGDGAVVSGGTNTTDFQPYTGVFRVEILTRNGSANLQVFSTDSAGNVETIQSQILSW